jgi:hypothetical protein
MTQRPPPLTLDEAASILGRMEEVVATKDVVLIGGQAVAIWAAQLVEYLGSEFDQTAVASSDVDFQGAKGPLTRASLLLGGELRIPTIDNATPMVGVVVFQDSDGWERELDFLPQPHGLKARDVAGSSIRIHVAHPNDGREIPLWIIHPQRCMESRIINSGLPNKDTPLAWAQVRASIQCVRAFSRAVLDSADTASTADARRTVLKLNERSFKFADRNIFARSIAVERGFDCFDAVLCDGRLGEEFVNVRYPQMCSRIASRRGSAS